MRLIDADALYNGAMKDEYFNFVAHDNHGRESFAYSCAMQRLAEAPTIDAIPVEWLREFDLYYAGISGGTPYMNELVKAWQKGKEAQDG